MIEVLFDATRLMARGADRSPTGIDRVTLAYARWLTEEPGVRLTPVWSRMGRLGLVNRIRFDAVVGRSRVENRTRAALGDSRWDALTTALNAASGEHTTVRPLAKSGEIISDVLQYAVALSSAGGRLRSARASAGTIYLNVSHFGLGNRHLLQSLKAQGIVNVAMLHDLIPIRHPEYCRPRADRRHAFRVRGMIDHANLVIANSQSTADDLVAYATELGQTAPPICIAPLGLEPLFLRPPAGLEARRPYFVCVGTIEPRKNLVFLLSVWRRLFDQLGARTPQLVLVGRRGWENEAIIDHLERAPAVVRCVHEMSGLEDRHLASLIGGATALLAPSIAEGFDLPVAEALALGAPVIASDIPVHRELAAGATLVDPIDGPGWLAAITEAMLTSRRPAPIDPPTWDRHFAIVGKALGLRPDQRGFPGGPASGETRLMSPAD
jgi:glycosyltransferase involved in cell wall biosynthesis